MTPMDIPRCVYEDFNLCIGLFEGRYINYAQFNGRAPNVEVDWTINQALQAFQIIFIGLGMLGHMTLKWFAKDRSSKVVEDGFFLTIYTDLQVEH